MTVWRDVIGQDTAVHTLQRAVTDPAAMTHAWLLTGPPGSGRSVAARAFAIRSREIPARGLAPSTSRALSRVCCRSETM